MATPQGFPWWETGIMYQIYPRSFQDSNADGIGDLQGIRSRLAYLEEFGVSTIWISPIYPSPMADFGDDVADYAGIHPMFGTMDDFLELMGEIHQRGMKLILDFVPNHTSNQHPWFLESQRSRRNPKRDWYIWRDPKPDGSPPNNWVASFGGSAWEWDAATGQYYLHLFAKEQPDLNWRNPEVVMTMLNALRFWVNRGVDGFCVNAIALLIKDALFRDETPKSTLHDRTANQPEVHPMIRKMRAVLDEYGNRVLIGEMYLPYPELMTYYGESFDECHLPFNVGLIDTPFQAAAIAKVVNEYERLLPKGGWPNWVLGNHDHDRIASAARAGQKNARIAQMLLLTLRGTPTMYYGDEIGMDNGSIPPEKYHDPQALNEPGVGRSRDLERTPMQWDAHAYAGFSLVEPWLPVNADYAERNVTAQLQEPGSMLLMVKQLIAIRRTSLALNHGQYVGVPLTIADVFAYLRVQGSVKMLIALNFADSDKVLNIPSLGAAGTVLLSTEMDRTGHVDLQRLKLRPHEGLLIQVG